MSKVTAKTHTKNLEGSFFWRHEGGLYYLIAGYGRNRAGARRDALRRHQEAKDRRFAMEKKARKALRIRRGL